jgi:UDP-N-acetylmuramyl pentapeptide phosphotransferase/UDP-N-acetylglucosamine-1-phosphate transferase
MGAAQPTTWVHILRQDVAPVLGAYVVFLAFLVAYGRGRRAREHAGRADERTATWRDLLRYLAATIAGGYVVFLSIVVLFYFVLGNEEVELITQAVREGSLLVLVIVVPAFLLLSWMDERRSPPSRPPPP